MIVRHANHMIDVIAWRLELLLERGLESASMRLGSYRCGGTFRRGACFRLVFLLGIAAAAAALCGNQR